MSRRVINVHLVIYKLCEEGSEIFDNMENLEPSFSEKIKMAHVYIARYITRNDNQLSKYETHFYHEKYRKYTISIECGKLKGSFWPHLPTVIFLFHPFP